MEGYLSQDELKKIGFRNLGEHVLISEKCSIYGAELISIGNYVRIDDFSMLVGNIEIKNFVHISPYCGIHGTGGGKVVFEDYTGLSAGAMVYAAVMIIADVT